MPFFLLGTWWSCMDWGEKAKKGGPMVTTVQRQLGTQCQKKDGPRSNDIIFWALHVVLRRTKGTTKRGEAVLVETIHSEGWLGFGRFFFSFFAGECQDKKRISSLSDYGIYKHCSVVFHSFTDMLLFIFFSLLLLYAVSWCPLCFSPCLHGLSLIVDAVRDALPSTNKNNNQQTKKQINIITDCTRHPQLPPT